MGPVEITAIAAVIVTVLTSLVVPYWLRRRQENAAGDATGLQSWQSVTAVLRSELNAVKAERDELKRQIVVTEEDCRARIRSLDADYSTQVTTARTRITNLESEVARLYVRIGRQEQRPDPP